MVANAVANWAPTADDLDEITSFAEYAELLKKNGVAEVVNVNDALAGSFKKTDKKELIGVPFIVLNWEEKVDEETGRSFAFVKVMTSDDRKLWFSDGSTGIYAQLQKIYEDTQKTYGIFCEHGLNRSDYTFTNEQTGKKEKATTFYLDVS